MKKFAKGLVTVLTMAMILGWGMNLTSCSSDDGDDGDVAQASAVTPSETGNASQAAENGNSDSGTSTSDSGSSNSGTSDSTAPVYVTAITMNETDTVLLNGTKTLSVTFTPADASDKTLTWTSSDESKATVENGLVKGLALGEVEITATAKGVAEGNTVSAKCKMTVTAEEKPVTTLTVKNGEAEATALTLKDSDSAVTLTETHEPADTTDAITWTSSDESVATVENGTVTPKKVGTATITVKANDNVSKEVTVTVEKTPVTSVTVSGETSVSTEGSVTLTASVEPANATNKTVTWKLAEGSVEGSSISEAGVLSTGTTAGTAKVIATADGVDSAAYEVTVAAPVDTSVYTLAGESETISLGKTVAEANEYLTAATTDWKTNTIGDFSDDFYNLSKTDRYLTLKVKGVAAFKIAVKNGTSGRNYTVKIGDAA
nr:Ig-like domain-containing protein [Treponema sp.]